MRPVRAKALIINAFALTGRIAVFNPYTQGAALGYVLLGLSARFGWLLTHRPPTVRLSLILLPCTIFRTNLFPLQIHSFSPFYPTFRVKRLEVQFSEDLAMQIVGGYGVPAIAWAVRRYILVIRLFHRYLLRLWRGRHNLLQLDFH